VFPQVVPLRWNIASFGDWGWNMASNIPFDLQAVEIDSTKTRGLTTDGWRASLVFERDEWAVRDELHAKGVVSTMTAPAVMLYYREAGTWEGWGEAGTKE
jgi:predicted membrane-bound spermidine synthase